MKASITMIVGVGALALAATTMLAGCGGSSTTAVTVSTPPALESPAVASPAAELPASVLDGVVRPAGSGEMMWPVFEENFVEAYDMTADLLPEQLSVYCAVDLASAATWKEAEFWAGGGGTVEEWQAALMKVSDNFYRLACARSK